MSNFIWKAAQRLCGVMNETTSVCFHVLELQMKLVKQTKDFRFFISFFLPHASAHHLSPSTYRSALSGSFRLPH